jgi:pyruvate formate lyase activating enzyme
LRRLTGNRPGGSLKTGIVFDIRRYSIHDGPGIRTTVFLKGCALSCWWCHNPESQASRPEVVLHEARCIRCGACVETCPHGAVAWVDGVPVTDRSKCEACGTCTRECHAEAREVAGREMTIEQVLAVVERDRPFYDESGGGVTLSGGEPLLQPHFTAGLLAAAKRHGLTTVLDTSGHAPWESLERLRGDVDLFLYDLKLVDAVRHRRYTGVSNHRILANLRRLSELGHQIVLRMPVVPGITDDPENVQAVRDLATSLPRLARVDLLPYHRIGVGKYLRLDRTYQLLHTDSPTRERMDEIASFLAAGGLPVGRD